MLKLGIIGDGRQAKRIIRILSKKKLSPIIYKPTKKKGSNYVSIKKIKDTKGIFICSPNNSHYEYIKKFYKTHYIFCEKPPVSNKKELNKLNRLNLNKIYFNFNYRFSKIAKALSKIKKYNFGNLLFCQIISGHGLAKKKDYELNWRSDIKKCKKGIFEVVSIHWLDLINYFFTIKKITKPKLTNISNIGNSYDTSSINLELKNGANSNIFSTYNSPLINKKIFVFENGVIIQNYSNIEIRGPALNFDKNKFFVKPRLIKKINYNEVTDYERSLKESVDYFLAVLKNKKKFSRKETKISLQSNKYLF